MADQEAVVETTVKPAEGGSPVVAPRAEPVPPTRRGGPFGVVARRVWGVLLLVVLIASGAYGGDFLGIRQRISPAPTPNTPVAHGVGAAPGAEPVLASQPYWRGLTTLQGTGPAAQTLTIDPGAIQWRVSWSCDTAGRLSVQRTAVGGAQKSLIDAACPGKDTAYATSTGSVGLKVTAAGPWRMVIDQQVDMPDVQPPLASMSAPGTVVESTGSFYEINRKGSGTVTVYRLANGSHQMRLDKFYVTPNTELEVRFSAPASPHSDEEVVRSPFGRVATLEATTGSVNFSVPADVDPAKFKSVVIWCLTVQTAYSAATLKPGP